MAPDLETMTAHEREAFWITNLRAALAMMLSKDDDEVALSAWRRTGDDETRCGTIACFGGWLPFDAHFQELGVKAHPVSFYPRIETEADGVLADFEVAGYLFGESDLFDTRTTSEWFLDELTDRDIVIRRITNRMRQLGVEA